MKLTHLDGRQLTTNAKWAHNVIFDNPIKKHERKKINKGAMKQTRTRHDTTKRNKMKIKKM
jgi:hypothetical protein